jgi:hypothetical protein
MTGWFVAFRRFCDQGGAGLRDRQAVAVLENAPGIFTTSPIRGVVENAPDISPSFSHSWGA